MAAPSSTSSPDFKTLPKLGPNSLILRKRSLMEEQEQRIKTRAAVNEYITRVFGGSLTESEKAFVAALNENGKFSLHLIIHFIFVAWYMTAVLLDWSILLPISSVVRCKIPAVEDCLNFSEILDISVMNRTPTIQNAITKQYCRYDDREYSKLVATHSCKYESILHAIKLESNERNVVPGTKPCEDFVAVRRDLSAFFKDNMPTSLSLTDDMNLFCDNAVWNRIFVLSKSYGLAFSMLVFALAADTFGRKRSFVIASLIHLISCILLFLPYKWCMALGFCLSGFGRCAIVSLYVLFLELCSDTMVYRFGLLLILLEPIEFMIIFLLNYIINMWVYVHLANTSMLLVLPFIIWYITESPRWLMFTGNQAAAWKVLKELESKAVPNDSGIHESVPTNSSRLTKILSFMNQHVFRERLTACIILFFLTSISFYVLQEEAVQDMHIGTEEFYLISFGFQVVVVLSAYSFALKYGRRNTSFVFYCLLSAFDALIFMENQYYDRKQILPLLLYLRDSLKNGISNMLFYYTCEIFPTPYRATALNLCLASAEIGLSIQQHFYDAFHPELKAITYMPPFIASVTCALVVSFLPRTKNAGLPDIPRDALLSRT